MIKIVQYLIKSIPNYSNITKSWEMALGSLATQGSNTPPQSKDIALFQRDWNYAFWVMNVDPYVERHCPVPKGLKRPVAISFLRWKLVERHCPVPKGLKRIKINVKINHFLSRKTLPCSKGIETLRLVYWCHHQTVERHCPVPKGLRHAKIREFWRSHDVERHCPAPKGLRLDFFCAFA